MLLVPGTTIVRRQEQDEEGELPDRTERELMAAHGHEVRPLESFYKKEVFPGCAKAGETRPRR